MGKLLEVFLWGSFFMGQDRKPYNEAIYLKALAKNSSTLLAQGVNIMTNIYFLS